MKKFFKFIITGCLLVVFFILIFYSCAFFIPLDIENRKENLTLYDQNKTVIYESNFKKELSWNELEEVPVHVRDMLISIEDQHFYHHLGFDPMRILKALITNILEWDIVQGGSTISQQMAKNLFLDQSQSVSRKLKELFYAVQMEMQYDKDTILEYYINTLYYGHGVYGLVNASEFFFGHSLDECSIAQIAMLIAIPNGPSLYSPLINEEYANQRKDLILSLLYQRNIMDDISYKSALDEELTYIHNITDDKDAYYIQGVLDELKVLSESYSFSLDHGVHVLTYLEPDIQNILHESIQKNQPLDELEVSAVILKPFSNAIVAIQGGKDHTISEFNRVLYAKRQAASTIKPLLYYTALSSGFEPSTTFLSTKTTFKIDETTSYAPTNYNDLYPSREISMINAIAMSDNIYAVKTHLFLGMDTLSQSLEAFGIEAQPYPSLALGSIDISLLDLTKIYNTFASLGYYYVPSFIEAVYSESGEVLYETDTQKKRYLNQDTTLILNQMLTSTFDIKNKTVSFPTMYGYKPKVMTAAKSGTSDSDSWVIGFNPQYTIGVWCGFDDSRFLDKTYYTVSKHIYQDTFNLLYPDSISIWYEKSNDIKEMTVDPITGKNSLLGSRYWFKK